MELLLQYQVWVFNEYSELTSFRMDWLDLPAAQGTLKNLLQHHSSKHPFFGAQLSLWSHSHFEHPQIIGQIHVISAHDLHFR